ncbi:MAG TPA: hypothetical protein PLD20_34400 [Blastocatellia bacterium]|nr:hypothetical protein [Blastocatellia bacterium]HMV82786.1 hypothetical protein [Blastocatellia bacterium]HMX28446.1 hypothetical protein [Blastocatellia bacterium]HMY77066.1 hypothetical protein [Blastocatellia bacterium]HMZ23067.1 hypothetical protein [Blastocatellia bacterium]
MMFTQVAEPSARLRPAPVRRFIGSRERVTQELNTVPIRILEETGGQLRLRYDENIIEFFVAETAAVAQHPNFVKQALERHLIRPLLRLIYTGQVVADETLTVAVTDDGNSLYFLRPQERHSRTGQLL